jgi:hypothetical protein
MSDQPFVWCVVANVTRELHPEGPDQELRLGMKRFAPGAKLYCFPISWGDGGKRLMVYGRHWGGTRLITAIVATKWLTDWRVKRVFNPALIERMKRRWGDSDEARTRTEAMADSFRATASP